tara:strand:+ start:2548 stop:3939 length:1392 start_codon:yes stop_codon:yes gene_type:complete
MIITRFAPSPTGTLHIGGVRTALFNYLHAKQNDGKFLIRIEDTDQDRSKLEYEENILNGLAKLGIIPDEIPIRQSERHQTYKDAAQKLIDSGHAYWCDCSKEMLDEMRKEQEAAGKKPMYDGRSRNLGLKQSENTVLRLATPEEGEITVNDLIRGEVRFQNSELDDLILLRSDGTPTYHLCNVVDDFEQNVTTVIRGEDHLSNTPRQMHIQQALGYNSLEYAHLPLVLGENKKRLSKRDAVTSLDDYLNLGYLPTSMINVLARLGWSKGDSEIFYMKDLLKDFRIQEVQKAAAIFNKTKLDWTNTNHLASLSDNEFIEKIRPFLDLKDISLESENDKKITLALRTSGQNLSEIANLIAPYFNDLDSYDTDAAEKFLYDSEEVLLFLQKKLSAVSDWNEANIAQILDDAKNNLGLSIPKVNQPIRIALTGNTKSPSLDLTLCLFGQDESLQRIEKAIQYIKSTN